VQPAARPDLDAIHGIPPTVAIEQRASRGGLKSTVATLTEIYHFLRLIYVRLGTQYCPDCEVAIAPQSADPSSPAAASTIAANRSAAGAADRASQRPLSRAGALGGGARCAAELRVDGKFVPTDPFPSLKRFVEHNIELPIAEVLCSRVRRRHCAPRWIARSSWARA
jgi:excinuclease ABC subunit A